MAVTPLRVVFAGTPEVAVPSLRALVASEHDVAGVLTRPDAPTGRGRHVRPSPVAVVAEEFELPLARPGSMAEPTIDSTMAEWAPDVVVVVAYGLLIPKRLLEKPRHGWINAHFSALPRWRGASPVQYAIAHGDRTTGVSVFRIEEGLDTGPILSRSEPIPIGERDDAGLLLDRLATIAADLLVETLDALHVGALVPTPQAADGVTFAPRITSNDARIDWRQPVDSVDRWIRACTPAPGAWTTLAGERLGIASPITVHHGSDSVPGRVTVSKKQVLVGAVGGQLELGFVTPPGKRPMSAPDWARGLRERAPRELGT